MATIIFDFDGTIADSFDFVADFLLEGAGETSWADDQKQALRGLSMVAMARQLGYSWWRMPRLLLKGRQRMSATMKDVAPFDGMPETIQKLHAEGHELFIVSTNSVKNIHLFLHQHQLHTYFLEVYGGISLFGKAPALRRLFKDQNLEKADAIYIGDETRDVQASQSIDLRVIAVTWGFARPSDLEALKPTALAAEPTDLIKILEEL
jgi:phosphoglycolate phosphatase-like HAD superfamily hydrolase